MTEFVVGDGAGAQLLWYDPKYGTDPAKCPYTDQGQRNQYLYELRYYLRAKRGVALPVLHDPIVEPEPHIPGYSSSLFPWYLRQIEYANLRMTGCLPTIGYPDGIPMDTLAPGRFEWMSNAHDWQDHAPEPAYMTHAYEDWVAAKYEFYYGPLCEAAQFTKDEPRDVWVPPRFATAPVIGAGAPLNRVGEGFPLLAAQGLTVWHDAAHGFVTGSLPYGVVSRLGQEWIDERKRAGRFWNYETGEVKTGSVSEIFVIPASSVTADQIMRSGFLIPGMDVWLYKGSAYRISGGVVIKVG